MNIKYHKDSDLLYIHFVSGVPNIHVKTKHDDVFKFVSKANRDVIIGYEIENASENMDYILKKLGLSRKQKFALILNLFREGKNMTQKEMAEFLALSESTYKAIERSEHNIGFDTLDVILNQCSSSDKLFSIFSEAAQKLKNNGKTRSLGEILTLKNG